MKFAIVALVGFAAAAESEYGYITRRATWGPQTGVTSGRAFAEYKNAGTVVTGAKEGEDALPTEDSWAAARSECRECEYTNGYKSDYDSAPGSCGKGGCGYGKSSYDLVGGRGYGRGFGYGQSCGLAGKGKDCETGCGYGRLGCGQSCGYKTKCYKPEPKVRAGYAGWEHCNNRLLRSLGRDDLAQGKQWGYAELTETPCKRGESYGKSTCGYGHGCGGHQYGQCYGHAYGACTACLDACVEPEEVVVEKAEPRVISMWENPVWNPNVRRASGLGGYTPGIKMIPGNAALPGAGPEPVPVRAPRAARKQVLKRDEPQHVIKTTTDCGGCGYCDECESSGAPSDWASRYSRPRYHDRRVRNYLW